MDAEEGERGHGYRSNLRLNLHESWWTNTCPSISSSRRRLCVEREGARRPTTDADWRRSGPLYVLPDVLMSTLPFAYDEEGKPTKEMPSNEGTQNEMKTRLINLLVKRIACKSPLDGLDVDVQGRSSSGAVVAVAVVFAVVIVVGVVVVVVVVVVVAVVAMFPGWLFASVVFSFLLFVVLLFLLCLLLVLFLFFWILLLDLLDSSS
jgi:hypothetical protein